MAWLRSPQHEIMVNELIHGHAVLTILDEALGDEVLGFGRDEHSAREVDLLIDNLN